MPVETAIDKINAKDQAIDTADRINSEQLSQKIMKVDSFLKGKTHRKLEEMKSKLSPEDYSRFQKQIATLELEFDTEINTLQYKLNDIELDTEDEYKQLIESYSYIFDGMEDDIKEFEHILGDNREIPEDELIAKVKEFSYAALYLNEDTYANGKIKQLVKGVIDTVVIENIELAKQVYDTKGVILVDMMKTIFSWEGLKGIAKGLGESIWGLFSGDVYKTGRSIGELGLITTGAGALGTGLKKGAKVAMKRAIIKGNKRGIKTAKVMDKAGDMLKMPAETAVKITNIGKDVVVDGVKKGVDVITNGAQKVKGKLKESDYGRVLANENGRITLQSHTQISKAIDIVNEKLLQHPKLTNIISLFLGDKKHKMNINHYLLDDGYRDKIIQYLDRIAKHPNLTEVEYKKIVRETQNDIYDLFTNNDKLLSKTKNGIEKNEILRQRLKRNNPELYNIVDTPNFLQRKRLQEYTEKLKTVVEPKLSKILMDLSSELDVDGFRPLISSRSKTTEGLLDKISRMKNGNVGRKKREDYSLASVPDAVGGRITVGNMTDLNQLIQKIESYFGPGNIIEKDNFYTNPSKMNRPHRLVTYTILIDDIPCEIQLSTINSSLVADLEHNTVYKEIHKLSSDDKEYVKSLARIGNAIDLQNI